MVSPGKMALENIMSETPRPPPFMELTEQWLSMELRFSYFGVEKSWVVLSSMTLQAN